MSDPSDANPLRAALIGYGLAGRVFHAPLIEATPGLELASIVTADPERAAAAGGRHPRADVLPHAEELWERAGDHDLVVVAAPNRAHAELALAAIGRGLPVVVDKPVAATVADARRIRDAAAARGVLATVFHNRRWDGDLLTTRRLLDAGDLGRVHRFESRFERWRPEPREGAWRELPEPAEAGGLLFDLGSHLIDQALTLFGPVARVYAELDAVREGARVDDDVFVALEHRGGTRSHLWASAAAADLGPRLRVLGSRAAYVKHGMDVQEEALKAGGSPADPGWGSEPEAAWGTLGAAGDVRPVPTEPGDYGAFYSGVRDALTGGAPPPVTIEEAIEVMYVIEAARRSAREGTTILL
jgi:predicted dehydrogenase